MTTRERLARCVADIQRRPWGSVPEAHKPELLRKADKILAILKLPGTPAVAEIVAAYLKMHGFDGLCMEDCGCGVDDLMPCGIPSMDCCVPAYRVAPPEGNVWGLGPDDPWYAAEKEASRCYSP